MAAAAPSQPDGAPPPPPPPLQLDPQTRHQLLVLCGTGMVAQMAIGMVVPLLPSYAAQIGLTSSGVGLVIAMPSVARLLLNLPLGSLVDLMGRRPPLIIGSVVEAVGSLGTALATSLGTMLAPRLLVGAGSAGTGAAGTAYMMDVVDKFPAHKGFLLGTIQASMVLAFAAGPACGGLIAEHSGDAALPFMIIAGVLGASVPLYMRLPETRSPLRSKESVGDSRVATLRKALTTATASFRTLLARPEQQALLALRFGLITGWSAWLTVLPLHATDMWSASAGDLGQMCAPATNPLRSAREAARSLSTADPCPLVCPALLWHSQVLGDRAAGLRLGSSRWLFGGPRGTHTHHRRRLHTLSPRHRLPAIRRVEAGLLRLHGVVGRQRSHAHGGGDRAHLRRHLRKSARRTDEPRQPGVGSHVRRDAHLARLGRRRTQQLGRALLHGRLNASEQHGLCGAHARRASTLGA